MASATSNIAICSPARALPSAKLWDLERKPRFPANTQTIQESSPRKQGSNETFCTFGAAHEFKTRRAPSSQNGAPQNYVAKNAFRDIIPPLGGSCSASPNTLNAQAGAT